MRCSHMNKRPGKIIKPHTVKELFTLNEEDIKPSIRTQILACTKVGDLTTPTKLAYHIGASYNGTISILHKLAREGLFEELGSRYVKTKDDMVGSKAFVFRRLSSS